ncbi:MAG: secondary thiamine-phosphate synthase enzyme YjbQ [Deltaproteobacteria bacterium]|nr:secondary thiamine-phosphate synthase enzyme YjbQ [Deltaproteobacteria bacterium]
MIYEHYLETEPSGLYRITGQVIEDVKASGVQEGVAVVYCPHTTAAITINEGADRSVAHDFLQGLDIIFPDMPHFTHAEGNSSAHLKSSVIGCSQTLLVEGGEVVLGSWQAVFFCEFDGPRRRRYYVKVIRER